MADRLIELDAASADPTLASAEADGRPAIVVDADGEIVWAGEAGVRLVGAAGFDEPTRRALGRMARTGTGGMLRLRFGGHARPVRFLARVLDFGAAEKLLALEGVARPDAAEPAPAGSEPALDVAALEGAARVVEQEQAVDAPVAGPATPSDDPPPDPRRDFVAASTAAEPEASARPDETPAESAPDRFIGSSGEVEPAPWETFRFTFEFDDRGRLAALSPEFERALGPTAAGALGREWSELAAELGLDREGAVAAALAGRGAWSDVDVFWPLADGRRARLRLSALPMFDKGRSFVGFRGLGRSFGAPAAEPDAPAAEPAAAAPEASAVVPEGDAAPAPMAEAPDMRAATDEPAKHEPPALVTVAPEQPSFSGNVVPIREAAARAAALSTSEVSAFDEIARRLQGLSRSELAEAETAERQSAGEPAAPEASQEAEGAQRELPFAAAPHELLRLLDRMPVGALVLRGGEIAHASRSALDLLGCREVSELSGRGADALFAAPLPRDREAQFGVMRLIAANGGEVEVDARLSTISWGGAPATLVTLRRPEAGAGGQRERDLAAALEVATDGVMTLDGAGRILSVNRGAEALFGFSAREAVGSLFTLSLAPESRRVAFDRLDRLKNEGAAPDGGVEVLGLSRQGGAAPLLMTIGRIGEEEADRYCTVLRDIAPWKKAEEELIAARRQAERANAQKSEFLAKVGHEIRTPLNAIIGFAEVMMEERFGPVGSPRYKDYLRDIRTSGDHLVKMIDDLLDITSVETGKLTLDFGPVDLNEIASQAAALLQPQANRDRVIIRTSLASGLPHVLADRRSVRQIMTNLAANAVKLSRPGGQVIVATALTDVGQAVFRVRDAGAGMTKQEIARAFEPFRPLAVADNDTGFSLGLPLTRALAEANQAVLALQSEAGRGTLAEVTFPASRVLAG
ncbi:PAS domain S-box protein [Chelatococcus sambhunathii]|uniref:histidine kinase n=1 Tax=Chelatococcus sambhunathii TaxID=363953 RepID=A0ABU1DKC7_9HYPH|nr:PAS domain S-box protein [Chelatococcus sambhunathii]MDR4308419.1 PAS domain S-box protein [Chelatococcus sambhunathii]